MDSANKPVRYTVYCHIHIESGRRYVGLTKLTMMKRWNQHVYNAESKKGRGCAHFWAAIRAYGKDAFSHEVLRRCSCLEEANAYEEYFIDLFRAQDPASGFNLAPGGAHTPHPFANPWHRPEYRQAATERSRIMWQDPVFRIKNVARLNALMRDPIILGKIGKAVKAFAATPEGRASRSRTQLGRVLSAEHRAKIAANNATKRPEVREKLSAKSKAAWAQPDFRKAASTRAKGQTASEETRAKISAAGRGRKLSAEWRQSISEAMKKLPRRMYCKQGHLLDDNSYGPRRQCRTCRNERQRARRAKARLTCSRSDSTRR